MTKKWPISRSRLGSGSIRVPEPFIKTSLDHIQFGRRRLPCHIIPSDTKDFQIDDALGSELLLPPLTSFHIKAEDRTLRLLPLIGFFTPHLKRGAQTPLGLETGFQYKWVKNIIDHGGYAFLFDGNHLHLEEGTLEGLIITESGWEEIELPLPDVVIDRTPNRVTDHSEKIQSVRSLFNKYDIPWVNPGFFDKWTVYKLLRNDQQIRPYLPETERLSHKSLNKMLHLYPSLYLKPREGTKGKGILKIQAKENNYLLRKTTNDEGFPLTVKKEVLWDTLCSVLSHPSRYIIQEGVPLLSVQNQPVDFRVHTNRDEKGQWQLSAIAAKRAPTDTITTHITYGGTVHALQSLFDQERARNELKRIRKIVCLISQALTSQLDGVYGELGFDLGIDQEGLIRLFEINAKPRHHIFLEPTIRHQLALVHSYWFDYCKSLAEYTESHLIKHD